MYVKHVPLGSDHAELHQATGKVLFGRAELSGGNPSYEDVIEAVDRATQSLAGDPDGLELRIDEEMLAAMRADNEEGWYVVKWAQFRTPSSDGEKLLVTSGALYIMGENGETVDRV